MNSYEEYLEKEIELKDQEISFYKKFIEEELRCRIKEEVFKDIRPNKNGIEEVHFKAVTIPQSQCIIKLGSVIKQVK